MHDTPHQRHVLLFHLAIAELARQLLVRSIVLCHNHQSRRAAIQTMDDPWPQFAAHSAQILDVMQQRVDQRSIRMAGAWMNDHSRRLVEYDHIGIFEHDAQRQRLGFRDGRSRCRDLDLERLSRSHSSARAKRCHRAADVSLFDEPLNARPRVGRQVQRQELIEPHPVMFGLDEQVINVNVQCSMFNAQLNVCPNPLNVEH